MSDPFPNKIPKIVLQSLLLLLIFFSVSLSFAQNQGKNSGPAPDNSNPQENTFQPGNHCILWLKADEYDTSSQSRIPVLHDFSGQNHHAVQQTTARQPLFIPNALGTKPAIRFDGIDDYLKTGLNVTGTKLTAFFILRVLSYATYNGFITLYNSNEPQDWNTQSALVIALHVPSPGLGGTRNYYFYGYNTITNDYCNINSVILRNDSTLTFSNNTNISKAPSPWTLNSDNLLLGARWENNSPFRFGNMELGELIIFDTSLSSADYQSTYDYLLNKYSLPKIDLGQNINEQYSLCSHTISLATSYDSYLWSTGDTTPELTIYQSGTYWVQVKDPVFGFLSADTLEVAMPVLDMPDRILCPGDSLSVFSGFSTGYKYRWSDVSNDSIGGDSSLTIFQPGQYALRVTDSLGCFLADTFNVLPDPFSTAVQFISDTLFACEDDSLHYPLPGSENYQYHWNTGITGPGILLQTEGWYSLTVTNETGCRSADSVFIRFKGYKPMAYFSLQDSVCTGSILTVSDSSWLHPNDTLSSIQTYAWMSGNTLLSQDSVFEYHVQTPYLNSLQLTITTTAGCSAVFSSGLVAVPPPDIYFATSSGCTQSPVCFTDLSSDSLSIPQYRSWTFGDPASGILNYCQDSSCCHTYNLPGRYPVKLQVSNRFGCTDSLTRQITIHTSPDLGFRHFDSCLSAQIHFADTTMYSSANPCLTRFWQFGDGNSSVLLNPVHQFSQAGVYAVSLTSKSLQCQTTVTKNLRIHAEPTSLFQAEDVCQGSPVTFTNLSFVPDDSIVSCVWNYDTLTGVTAFNPVHIFTQPGNYPVYLQVVTNANCINDTTFTLQVFEKPTAGFTYTITQTTPQPEICFTNQSLNAINYFWYAQQNLFSSLENPCHSFADSDSVEIMLIAQNSSLCNDSVRANISFIPQVIDIEILDYTIVSLEDSYELNINVQNNGNTVVKEIIFSIILDNSTFFEKELNTIIAPNTKVNLQLSLNKPLLNNSGHLMSCITADLPGLTDINPENNTKCETNYSDLHLINYEYNSGILNLITYSDTPDNLQIKLFTLDGKIVSELNIYTPAEQTMNTKLNIPFLKNSIYILQLKKSNISSLHKLIIINTH